MFGNREVIRKIDMLQSELNACRTNKLSLSQRLDKVEAINSNIGSLVSTHENQLHEMERTRDNIQVAAERDREAFLNAIDGIKKQLSDLKVSVTGKLLEQDQQSTVRTADMIERHDAKTLRLFEKIEKRIESNEKVTYSEFNKIHDKMDIISKNQWRAIGFLTALSMLGSYYINLNKSAPPLSKHEVAEIVQFVRDNN